jgi:MgtE intracellular N domain
MSEVSMSVSSSACVTQLLEALSADQRTEIVRGMGEVARRRLIPKLSPEVRTEVESLLQYPERTAGGIMTTEFVRLDPGMTVGDALRHIRSVAQEKESHLRLLRDGPRGEAPGLRLPARPRDGGLQRASLPSDAQEAGHG